MKNVNMILKGRGVWRKPKLEKEDLYRALSGEAWGGQKHWDIQLLTEEKGILSGQTNVCSKQLLNLMG